MTTVRFAVIGLNHNHIFLQVNHLLRAGAEFISFYAPEPELVADFAPRYPQAKLARSEQEILDDESIHIVVSASIPVDRAPLGIRVMQHGKDFMSDKPGFTTLDQLAEARRVQAETQRIYSICYSERFDSPATLKAAELVQQGVIGRVVQTVGLGPHRIGTGRPDWYWQLERFGGIICDIASHQMDQFLYFTGSTSAEVVAAQVANFNHPERENWHDFGDVTLRSPQASGYVRVDWFTPTGLPVWGDGRLFLMGTDGYMELRKYIDVAGKPGGNHLFYANNSGVEYVDCSDVPLTYGEQLVYDVINRTETAMTQAHCFLASELALRAQAMALQNTR